MSNALLLHGDASMDLVEIARLLDEEKAQDILLLDLTGVHNYLSYFLIATALSPLHLKKLYDSLHRPELKKLYSIEDGANADPESGWVILDFGSFIVHLFTKEKRELYKLEDLWSKANVVPWKG
ncbi:MAG: ribosome silencing factor [Candidatus Hydrogenedentota bacterium]|nr:MAG: ribosome silencing factor [Candidatus Hydrogenedentota bacterium]